MSWWIWTLGGIASYLLLGIGFGLLNSYVEGRVHPDVMRDTIDFVMPIFVWPLLILLWVAVAADNLSAWLHRRGATYTERCKAREAKKEEARVAAEIKKIGRQYKVKKNNDIPVG